MIDDVHREPPYGRRLYEPLLFRCPLWVLRAWGICVIEVVMTSLYWWGG